MAGLHAFLHLPGDGDAIHHGPKDSQRAAAVFQRFQAAAGAVGVLDGGIEGGVAFARFLDDRPRDGNFLLGLQHGLALSVQFFL